MKRSGSLSEKIVGVILLGVAGFVFFDVRRLPDLATTDLLGPKLYPLVLAVLLGVLSGLFLMGLASSHRGDPSIALPGILRRFLPLLFFSALYVILLPPLGFLVATTALLAASFRLLGERRLWLNFLIGGGCTLSVYLLFAHALGIPLKALPW